MAAAASETSDGPGLRDDWAVAPDAAVPGGLLGAERRAIGEVIANRELRCLILAGLVRSTAEWGAAVALGIYAFREGGTAAVGVMALVRTLPGAIVTPWLALLADRRPRRTILMASVAVRAVALAAVALAVLLSAPLGVVYGAVAVFALAGPAYRPAQYGLLPRLARTPGELTSANVVLVTTTQAGFLVGSLTTAVLLGLVPAGLVFLALALTFAYAVWLLARLEGDPAPSPAPSGPRGAATLAGFRLVAGSAQLRPLVGIAGALTFLEGAMDVLVVVVAFELLGTAEAGVGALNAAFGIGGALGGGVALTVIRGDRLRVGFVGGAAALAVALALLGSVPVLAVAAVALIIGGIGYVALEVAAATLLQRLVADHLLARVFGVVEVWTVVTSAVGALGAALVADAFGAGVACVSLAALMPLVIALRYRRLASFAIGAPVAEREYALLRGHRIFAGLPVATNERLAHALVEVRLAPGEVVIREGDVGDLYYLVAAGAVDVSVGPAPICTLGPGEGFGEIALLRDVPRTATVRAQGPAVLLALDREPFLAAVTGRADARPVTV